MFKKPFSVRGRTVLRESDKRRLRQDILKKLPGLAAAADAEERLAALLPSKRADVEVVRLVTYQDIPVKVYTTAGEPLFVELERPTSATTIFPTVYALAQLPAAALPPLLTHGPLLPILQRGADLMFPGVIFPGNDQTRLGDFAEGELRALWVGGVDAPAAVAETAQSSQSPGARARKGKALRMLHMVGDRLWQMGSKHPLPTCPSSAISHLLPPPYAIDDRSLETDLAALDLAAMGESDDWEDVLEEANQGTGTTPRDLDGEAPSRPAEGAQDANDNESDSAAAGADVSVHPSAPSDQGSASALVPSEIMPSSTGDPPADDDMDALLDAAFFLALRRSVKDKDLPLLASTFYAQHMLPTQPRGQTVDIKRSSHKKLGKFLSNMEKAGVIVTKEVKGVLSITGVARNHERLTRFKPSEWESSSATGSAQTDSAASNAQQEARPGSQEPYIIELFRTTSTFADLFEASGKSRNDYLSHSDVRAALNDYVARHGLANKENPRLVVLDPFLAEHLVPKNDRANVFNAPRDALASTLTSKLHAFYRVNPPNGESQLRKGHVHLIEIIVEQRGGRRSVTRISGLETFGVDPDKFAKDMQKKLACSTSVTPLPGKQVTGVEVLLQGNMASEISDHLIGPFGIPRKYISITDRTK